MFHARHMGEYYSHKKRTNTDPAAHDRGMKTYTKLTESPELNTIAVARFTALALTHVASVYGPDDQLSTNIFRPSDVARVVVESIAPRLLKAREIAELERDIAELKLAKALARIAVLEEA
jgi:hypothetical protein